MAPLLDDEEELLAVGVELGADRLLELALVVVVESSPLVTVVVVDGVLEVVVAVEVLWW